MGEGIQTRYDSD